MPLLPQPVTWSLTGREAYFKSVSSGQYSGMIFYPGGDNKEECQRNFWRWIGAC